MLRVCSTAVAAAVGRQRAATAAVAGLRQASSSPTATPPADNDWDRSQADWVSSGAARRGQLAAELHQVFDDLGIASFCPTTKLSVAWSGASARWGNVLACNAVTEMPAVEWEAQPEKLYTLVMTDPDAPMRWNPMFREWHHFLASDIPDAASLAMANTLGAWVPSAPPPDTGLHRYVFLLFEQSCGALSLKDQPILTASSGDGRGGWSVAAFAEKHSLTPVGLAFYQTEYDDSVPAVYAQLGMDVPVFSDGSAADDDLHDADDATPSRSVKYRRH